MRLKVNGVTLNYELDGQGPPLVLTHGLGSSLEFWSELVPRFSRHYRTLTWDVRGFGESDKTEGDYTPQLWAHDLSLLLKKLGLPKAHICGISMGGVLVQRFALDFPELTRSLIAVSTSSQVGEKATQAWEAQARAVAAGGLAALASRPQTLYSVTFAQKHPELVRQQAQRQLRNDPQHYIKGMRAIASYNYTAELERLRCPTLILQGGLDPVTPPGGSVIMHRRIPGSELHIIEDCGHGIPLEMPDLFYHLVRRFIERVEAGATG